VSYNRLPKTEPAALVGAITSAVGSLALIGADVPTLQSLGTALGISATQGVLTRQRVFSPQSVTNLTTSKSPVAALANVLNTGGGAVTHREPALGVGLVSLVGGFLVQFFAGVDLTQALASAAAIGGVQGVATRGGVYSPASAQRIAASRVVANEFSADERQTALRALASAPAQMRTRRKSSRFARPSAQ
jgi:hypothetical protein